MWDTLLASPPELRPHIVTAPIEVQLVAGTVDIAHDLGRPIAGYLVIWADGPFTIYVDDPAAPTDTVLTLASSTAALIRLVLVA